MKTSTTLSVLLCCAFAGPFHLAQAQSEKSGNNKQSVETKAAAERAFDAVVSQDRKSNLALTFTPRGTGETTGHVITITVQNVGSTPVQLVATGKEGLDALAFVDDHIGEAANLFNLKGKYEDGLIDLECSMAFIPSNGKYQSYVATESKWPPGISEGSGTPNEHGQTPITTISPGESVVIPIHGYCADIHQPPVPSGVESTPVSSWISPGDAKFPGPDELQSHGIQTVDAPAGGGPYLANIPDLFEPKPGHTIALGGDTGPEVTAAFLFDAIDRITITTDILQDAGLLTTPFSARPEQERPAVIQQAFWLYSSVLTGDTYTREEFSERMTTQYEENTGTKIKNAAPEVQERLESGVDDFWGSFNLVGGAAKVIKETGVTQANIPPDIRDKIENELGKHDAIGVKIHSDGRAESAAEQMGVHATAQGNEVVTGESRSTSAVADEVVHDAQLTTVNESEDDSEEDDDCSCQEMSVEVVTVKGSEDELDPDRINISRNVTNAGAEVKATGGFKSDNEFVVDYGYQIEKGDTFSVELRNVELSCLCNEDECPDIHARYREDGKPSERSAGKYSIKNTNTGAKILKRSKGSKARQVTDSSAKYIFTAQNDKPVTETLSFLISAYCASDGCLRAFCVYKFKLKIKFNQ